MKALSENGIGSEVHYIPLYRHPAVQKIRAYDFDSFPETEKYYKQTLTIPLYFEMSESDVELVARTLLKILRRS